MLRLLKVYFEGNITEASWLSATFSGQLQMYPKTGRPLKDLGLTSLPRSRYAAYHAFIAMAPDYVPSAGINLVTSQAIKKSTIALSC